MLLYKLFPDILTLKQLGCMTSFLPSFSLQNILSGLGLLAALAVSETAGAQIVTSVSNNLVATGDNITLTGNGLANVSQVLLDGQPLVVSNKNNAALTVTIPKGASSGYLRLITSSSSMVLATVRIRVKRASSSANAASNTVITMPSISAYSTPVVTDLDLDGRVDLLLGDEDGNLWNFEQSTNGSFPSTGTKLTSSGKKAYGMPVANFAKPAVTDLDGDGKLDLLVGTGTDQGVMRFEQLGGTNSSTSFGPGELLTNGSTAIVSSADYPKPAITDLDGDGLLDLLLGDDSGRIARYEQQGPTGTAATAFASLGFLTNNFASTIDVGYTSKPIVLDWDGNGLLDMLVGNYNGTVVRYEQAQANGVTFVSKGDMTTNGSAAINAGAYSAPAVTDLDNNGQMDLLVGNYSGSISRFEQGVAAPVTPLPVVLVAFTGQVVAGGNQLVWATAQEVNSARFVVEVSVNGEVFAAVAALDAAGNSSSLTTYVYLDATAAALAAGRRYYRLRQDDLDGKVSYSPVVSVRRAAGAEDVSKFSAYPNPFVDKLLVALPGQAEPQATALTLSTLAGRPVYATRLELAAAPQALPGLPELPAGIYLLRLTTAEGTSTQKLTRE